MWFLLYQKKNKTKTTWFLLLLQFRSGFWMWMSFLVWDLVQLLLICGWFIFPFFSLFQDLVPVRISVSSFSFLQFGFICFVIHSDSLVIIFLQWLLLVFFLMLCFFQPCVYQSPQDAIYIVLVRTLGLFLRNSGTSDGFVWIVSPSLVRIF